VPKAVPNGGTMKQSNCIKVLMLVIMLMLAGMLAASTNEGASVADLQGYGVAFLAAIISFALGRYLKSNVEVQKIIPVLAAIISACFSTEKETMVTGKPEAVVNYDDYRAVIAATKVETTLNASGQGTLKKVFGTALDAVKFVFPLIKPVVKLLK